MTARSECVGLIAADPVTGGQVLGGFDHAADGTESPCRLRHFAPPIEPVVQGLVPGPGAPARGGGVVLDIAHRLDTTGQHQRVLFNLGLPIKPTQSVQQEGRIYRVGQVSDAPLVYFSTGTNFERWTFAHKVGSRAGTAENLAMGELARRLRESFTDCFQEARPFTPDMAEGKGGKDRIVPLVNSKMIAKLLPNAKLHVVKGGGHLFIVSRLAEILPLMREFLAEPLAQPKSYRAPKPSPA